MNEYSESLVVHFRRIEHLKKEAHDFPSVDLNARQLCDLELLLNRALFPLRGYLSRADYISVLRNTRLVDGTLWPVPVCLDVQDKTARSLNQGDRIALRDPEGFMLAVLSVEDLWQPDKKEEAMLVYGTDNPAAHAGVRALYDDTGDWYIGGTIEGVHFPVHYDFRDLRFGPPDVHRRFSMDGWRNVLGIHTDRYLHRKHREMFMQAAHRAEANIFLQPCVGLKHPGDLDYFTHISCYLEFAKKFPRNMIFLSLIPYSSRKAGPREALWQAIIRKNYGCSHFAVLGDHADPEEGTENARFYREGEAQAMVRDHESETGIKAVDLQELEYVDERAEYVAVSECLPDMTVKRISDSELLRRLQHDLEIPEWFTYPEIVSEMKRGFPPKSRQGFTVFMTGLSGSGKSTLAKVLMVKFMELRNRPVTLLDGDVVRKNLSSELNFSREHRDLNITRIGFVASEITKNGGIAICAPIAPYEKSRRVNRDLISRYGGYVEVYLSTPLQVCEQRDRKGLYAKARSGLVKGVTGVSDPYESPTNPEITIDTTELNPEEAAQKVLLYLAEQGYIT